ncbi:MAG: hypothetical protein HPY75_06090 [Actinobacteria bacterium]|nr:hypothetical protein [Actinomycetota bacterium]
MGLRGGVVTGSPAHKITRIMSAVQGAVFKARRAAFSEYAKSIFSSQPGLWDTILYNPVSNIVVGAAEMVAGGIAIAGTGGMAIEIAGPVAIDGANRFIKGIYKLSTGDWTGKETESWWPIP